MYRTYAVAGMTGTMYGENPMHASMIRSARIVSPTAALLRARVEVEFRRGTPAEKTLKLIWQMAKLQAEADRATGLLAGNETGSDLDDGKIR